MAKGVRDCAIKLMRDAQGMLGCRRGASSKGGIFGCTRCAKRVRERCAEWRKMGLKLEMREGVIRQRGLVSGRHVGLVRRVHGRGKDGRHGETIQSAVVDGIRRLHNSGWGHRIMLGWHGGCVAPW